MSTQENLVEAASKVDFSTLLSDLSKAISSGKVMNDPNMLLALTLFGTAGIILLVCIFAFFLRRSGSSNLDESAVFIMDSRIQALEIALLDHRNLAISLKNQSKADFAYFKQEMKNLHQAIDELNIGESRPAPRRLRTASNS